MKRARAHVAHAFFEKTAAKFVAGLAGEGHGKNLIRRDVVVRDSTLDTQGQYVGLSRTGRRSYEMAACR